MVDVNGRTELVSAVAEHLIGSRADHPLRVGIDGPCGSGKSTLAAELVGEITSRGSPALALDSDGFHQPREIRYRQGATSARGYYEDAYDFDALVERVLAPLGGGGSGRYATKVHDLATDRVETDLVAIAAADAILVFDCTFLQRGPLRDHWDEVIYLRVGRELAVHRGVARDAARLGGIEAALTAYEARYMAAYDIYVREENPEARPALSSTRTTWNDLGSSEGLDVGLHRRGPTHEHCHHRRLRLRPTRRADGIGLNVASAGKGPPVVLLHGFPQTHVMWRKVATVLATDHAVVAPDLRGYGASDKPPESGPETYSKATMARDIVEVMRALGHNRFALVGHDRGALVGVRAALDHDGAISQLGILDVLPTMDTWDVLRGVDAKVARHLYLMAQPKGLPEKMINAVAEEFFASFLDGWTPPAPRSARNSVGTTSTAPRRPSTRSSPTIGRAPGSTSTPIARIAPRAVS